DRSGRHLVGGQSRTERELDDPELDSADVDDEQEYAAEFEEVPDGQHDESVQRESNSSGTGWGIILMLVVMAVSRAPSLVRLFQDDRPPAANQQHLRDLERNLERLRIQPQVRPMLPRERPPME